MIFFRLDVEQQSLQCFGIQYVRVQFSFSFVKFLPDCFP